MRRIARQQVEAALSDLEDPERTLGERVHAVRRRCKKLRGLIQLVHPAFPDAKREDGTVRDAARLLADLRDSDVLVETLDVLTAADDTLRLAAVPARTILLERRATALSAADQSERAERFRADFEAFLPRIDDWRFDAKGYALLEGGLMRTVRRMRRAMDTAQEEQDGEHLHEWRKEVKYHGHHLALLRELAPPLIDPLRDLADRLGLRLGLHHDLAVLADELGANVRMGNEDASRQLLKRAISQRSEALAAEAFVIGRALASEKPRPLAARYARLWANWQTGDRLSAEIVNGSDDDGR
ncbi:CHAD domain-containing protein [Arsenicitalea aurantiaca]|uniref:CHAD domain-containing protein n=1 Tax=Arsenicitalea aurantiaca TaxID=1783274 RepID=UPI0024534C66|nr:CHAD domain-containing protein [Arsenicitalea aurantiaca]